LPLVGGHGVAVGPAVDDAGRSTVPGSP
jgi:hypothetical protein